MSTYTHCFSNKSFKLNLLPDVQCGNTSNIVDININNRNDFTSLNITVQA